MMNLQVRVSIDTHLISSIPQNWRKARSGFLGRSAPLARLSSNFNLCTRIHLNQRAQHRIDCGHDLRVRLVGLLRDDHVRELGAEVDIRLLQIARSDRSKTESVSLTNKRLTRSRRRNRSVIADALHSLGVADIGQRHLPNCSGESIGERAVDDSLVIDGERLQRTWGIAVLGLVECRLPADLCRSRKADVHCLRSSGTI